MLLPAPVSTELRPGSLLLGAQVSVIVDAAAQREQALGVARWLADFTARTQSITLDVRTEPAAEPGTPIVLRIDPALSAGGDHADEAYDLDVRERRIVLSARTPHGLFNGATTLWQLIDASSSTQARIPAQHIVDYPRFAWRGLLLDSARHMQSPEAIKRFIETMALHKLDVLHWHLTDDQGWRIEIRKHPKLTQVGAWRDPQPNEAALVDPATGKYGGYYTQAQIRDIVAFAAQRFVAIVPEIDMPGHAQAAIAAYPQLGVTGKQLAVSSHWGIGTNLYNLDESTFAFIDDVIGEVAELFPSPYIHVGGDEAAKDQWQASPRIQARMRKLDIADEDALQGYFTVRVEAMLRKRGRKLVGWDEILETGLPPGATVMSWRGSEGAIAAARHGDDVVMAPDPVMYLDHLQGDAAGQPPGRVKVLSLADVYAFEALPPGLDAAQAAHVIGAQANLWSEYLTTAQRVEYAAFPRAAALAEKLWSPAERTAWNEFVARLPALFDRYRALGIAYSDAAIAPQIEITMRDAPQATISQQVAFGTLRYTLDGSAPRADSPAYAGPISAPHPTLLQAATFSAGKQVSTIVRANLDPATASRRASDRLGTCNDSLLLRLEGAPDANGTTPFYNVDLMNPCWIYRQVDFDKAARIDIRIGALPYFFELWHDAAKVVRHAASGANDELRLHLDRCDAAPFATVAAGSEPVATRSISGLSSVRGVHDVCIDFATHGDDPLRVIEWVQPITRD
jgi:hexosaminidase